MSVCKIHTSKMVSLAVFVVGAFTFSIPQQAFAVSGSHRAMMDDMTMGQSAVCLQQGCIQQHGTCEEHCVRPSTNHQPFASVTNVSQNLGELSVVSEYQSIVDLSDIRSLLSATPDRAPPSLQLLHGVVKRE